MNRFAYTRASSAEQASALLKDARFRLPVLKAGGVDVLDHLKERLSEPDLLIDIRSMRGGEPPVRLDGSTIIIQATCTLTQIADSPIVREHAPVLAQAIAGAASPQVRNTATAAGNLLQRPRCWYYRHHQIDCLKKGGATCFSVEGENRYHAIFGNGPCHIVHPSNLAPALWVCGGVAHLTGGDRQSLAMSDLFHMPEMGVRSEHNLTPGDVVTHLTCQASHNSGFYAIKEKMSFDWPLVAAAVSLSLDGPTIRSARVCAGAVAPVPWALPAVETALTGVAVTDDAALRRACAASVEEAEPMRDNAYKLKLLPVAVRRAVLRAAGKSLEEVES